MPLRDCCQKASVTRAAIDPMSELHEQIKVRPQNGRHREKLEWIEEAETLALRFQASREQARKQRGKPHHG